MCIIFLGIHIDKSRNWRSNITFIKNNFTIPYLLLIQLNINYAEKYIMLPFIFIYIITPYYEEILIQLLPT